jgi:hypothetical protein
MPRRDKVNQLNNEIFPDSFQQLTLNKQGYEENKKEENVLS